MTADVAENARIEDSVATELLNRTLEMEEQELYRHIDAVNNHAGRVDNRTNSIIEEISDQLHQEYTVEVGRFHTISCQHVMDKFLPSGKRFAHAHLVQQKALVF